MATWKNKISLSLAITFCQCLVFISGKPNPWVNNGHELHSRSHRHVRRSAMDANMDKAGNIPSSIEAFQRSDVEFNQHLHEYSDLDKMPLEQNGNPFAVANNNEIRAFGGESLPSVTSPVKNSVGPFENQLQGEHALENENSRDPYSASVGDSSLTGQLVSPSLQYAQSDETDPNAPIQGGNVKSLQSINGQKMEQEVIADPRKEFASFSTVNGAPKASAVITDMNGFLQFQSTSSSGSTQNLVADAIPNPNLGPAPIEYTQNTPTDLNGQRKSDVPPGVTSRQMLPQNESHPEGEHKHLTETAIISHVGNESSWTGVSRYPPVFAPVNTSIPETALKPSIPLNNTYELKNATAVSADIYPKAGNMSAQVQAGLSLPPSNQNTDVRVEVSASKTNDTAVSNGAAFPSATNYPVNVFVFPEAFENKQVNATGPLLHGAPESAATYNKPGSNLPSNVVYEEQGPKVAQKPKAETLPVAAASQAVPVNGLRPAALPTKQPPIQEPECNEWTPWSPCSLTCGGGLQERQRYCFTPKTTDEFIEREICNTDPCPEGKQGNTSVLSNSYPAVFKNQPLPPSGLFNQQLGALHPKPPAPSPVISSGTQGIQPLPYPPQMVATSYPSSLPSQYTAPKNQSQQQIQYTYNAPQQQQTSPVSGERAPSAVPYQGLPPPSSGFSSKPGICHYNGGIFNTGDSWLGHDCSQCTCDEGDITCNELDRCPPPGTRPMYSGSCEIPSTGGNGNGACCTIPFIHKGTPQNSCVLEPGKGLWCSVTLNFDKDGLWGLCGNCTQPPCLPPLKTTPGAFTNVTTQPRTTPSTIPTTLSPGPPTNSCDTGTPWSSWSECDKTCGGGSQYRQRNCSSNGRLHLEAERKVCNTNECPIACDTGTPWSSWSECDKTCGGGSQYRQRNCSSNGRLQLEAERKVCNTNECPIECSSWSNWTTCSKTCGYGFQQRFRNCTSDGEVIPFFESKQCYLMDCPPVCYQWGEWSTCTKTCGGGVQERERNCTLTDGVTTDTRPFFESRDCNTEECPPVCSQWGTWTECTKSCGEGTRWRVTNCTLADGSVVSYSEHTVCNTEACPLICDSWQAWTPCPVTCGGGKQSRQRNCTYDDRNVNITNVFSEVQLCNPDPCPVDTTTTTPFSQRTTPTPPMPTTPRQHDQNCTNWGRWSECTVTCGGGEKFRTRECTRADGTLNMEIDEQGCNEQPCIKNCGMWSAFGECSVSCGGGIKERWRTCDGEVEADTAQCNTFPCTTATTPKSSSTATPTPPTATKITNSTPSTPTTPTKPEPPTPVCAPWGEWSECSATCNGMQTRVRHCKNNTHESDELQARPCNTNPCPTNPPAPPSPTPPACAQWSDWSDCTRTCGGGYQERYRTCEKYTQEIQSRLCNTQPCFTTPRPDISSTKRPTIPPPVNPCLLAYLSFDNIDEQNRVVFDNGPFHNDAYLEGLVHFVHGNFSCGNAARLEDGEIMFDGDNFHPKPLVGITIAAWIFMESTTHRQVIFATGSSNENEDNYFLEIEQGKIRWYHKHQLFFAVSESFVPENTWFHLAGTYDVPLKKVRLYVNAEEVKMVQTQAMGQQLSTNLTGLGGIGQKIYQTRFKGLIDEFYVFNCSLTPTQIREIADTCKEREGDECPSPLLGVCPPCEKNCTTVMPPTTSEPVPEASTNLVNPLRSGPSLLQAALNRIWPKVSQNSPPQANPPNVDTHQASLQYPWYKYRSPYKK